MTPTVLTASNPMSRTVASPLQLVDRLITLAQDADRAGHLHAASQLLSLVDVVLDGGSVRSH